MNSEQFPSLILRAQTFARKRVIFRTEMRVCVFSVAWSFNLFTRFLLALLVICVHLYFCKALVD